MPFRTVGEHHTYAIQELIKGTDTFIQPSIVSETTSKVVALSAKKDMRTAFFAITQALVTTYMPEGDDKNRLLVMCDRLLSDGERDYELAYKLEHCRGKLGGSLAHICSMLLARELEEEPCQIRETFMISSMTLYSMLWGIANRDNDTIRSESYKSELLREADETGQRMLQLILETLEALPEKATATA